eukprot:6258933-Prymnesium_polylepis.1
MSSPGADFDINRRAKAAQDRRLSAPTLRPSAAPGLPEAPVRSACTPSGQRAWSRRPRGSRAT